MKSAWHFFAAESISLCYASRKVRAALEESFVHLPTHPFWFWLIDLAPVVLLLVLWVVANTTKVPLKPLARWLWVGYVLLFIPYLLVEAMSGHKTLRLVVGTASWTCWALAIWIGSHSKFETLRAPGAKWYFPGNAVTFSVPAGTRILVRNLDSVAPWYIEKLGLYQSTGNNVGDSSGATFRFKEDGNAVVLASRGDLGPNKTPMLFTKKVGKMRDLLAARGVNVGTIERDRQGIEYFEIRDPEGNEIEVVEEH
jgi:predicted enzyme related to lactoylglutathione lyase